LLRHFTAGAARRHFPITFIDARNDQRFDVWVVPAEHYICGLGDWYNATGMCVGGIIELTPTEAPDTFQITIGLSRTRRSEWVRSATVADGDLSLQMQRVNLDVRCDRNMLIDVPEGDEIARLMVDANASGMSLSKVVHRAFEELAKLSSRGLVHVKSLYSAANLIRRTGAVPAFAELTRRSCYDPVGDGFWAYSPEAEDKVYRTPETMRERPLSSRPDLVKDQAIEYLG
jgi:hypothetical protein